MPGRERVWMAWHVKRAGECGSLGILESVARPRGLALHRSGISWTLRIALLPIGIHVPWMTVGVVVERKRDLEKLSVLLGGMPPLPNPVRFSG
jgi:hypothetical protein